MKNLFVALIPVGLLLLAGCDEPESAGGSPVISPKVRETVTKEAKKAEGLARSNWLSASEEAQKVSDRTKRDTLDFVRSKMIDLQSELANIKLPDNIDTLRQAYVEEEVARLDAAIEQLDLQAKVKKRVEDAKKLAENAERTTAEVQAALAKTDKAYKGLMEQIAIAKSNYAAAEETVAGFREELKKVGAVLPGSNFTPGAKP
jgi:chromosome segregation ATPase